MGQARGGLLEQGDGLQAKVEEVLLLHVLQETQWQGYNPQPSGPDPQSIFLEPILRKKWQQQSLSNNPFEVIS